MARLGFLFFTALALAFGWYHMEVAYLLDVWGVSGKAPVIAEDQFKPIDRSAWQLHDVSSFEEWNKEGLPENAWDGNPETFWHSAWKTEKPKHPHHLAIDMGRSVMVYGVSYLPRQNGPNGRVKGYRISLSEDGESWEEVAAGDFPPAMEKQLVRLNRPATGRFLRFDCLSESNDGIWAAIAELDALTLE